MRKNFGWVMMVLSIFFTLSGCGAGGGGGTTDNNTSNSTLTALSITPANPSIAKGTSQQFTATGTYSDNTTKDLTTFVNWSSSAPAVATTSDAGLATTAATGGTTIYATSGNVSGSTILTVYEATFPVAPTSVTATAGNNQAYIAGAVSQGQRVITFTGQPHQAQQKPQGQRWTVPQILIRILDLQTAQSITML